MNYDKNEALRVLWILFSDINTRLNILKEESAHLQNTIYSLSDSKYVKSIFKKSKCDDASTGANGQERIWAFSPDEIHKNRLENGYSTQDTREKSYSHLVEFLGAILSGLEENKKTILRLYISATKRINSEEFGSDSRTGLRAFFHFLAARGSLVNSGIAKYTNDLEMAHEKLVQMLENHAGNLPQPLLFRRWNSGLIEGFFSDYSRHVSWLTESQLVRNEDNFPSKNPHTVIHTWTHSATSHFEGRSVKNRRTDGGDVVQSISLIRSAYFYLEQPVLLPLLYHEMAHSSYEKIVKNDGNNNALAQKLLDAKEHFIDALTAVLQQEVDFVEGGNSANYWDSVVGEIWCDVISIVNGGRGYLLALMLQISGQNGAIFYPIYESGRDALQAYDQFIDERLFHENPGPIQLTADYFWEARLLIAAWLLKTLRSDKESIYFAETVQKMVEVWTESGYSTLEAKKILAPQRHNWDIRCKVNKWLVDGAKRYLIDTLPDLSKVKKSNWLTFGQTGSIGLNAPGHLLISSIADAVKAYLGSVFNTSGNNLKLLDNISEEFSKGVSHIDDLAVQTRLCVSNLVVTKINEIFTDLTADIIEREQRFTSWVATFSDYCRHDGSTAFRMGLEAVLARDSMILNLCEAPHGEDNSPESIRSNPVMQLFECEYATKENIIEGFSATVRKIQLNGCVAHELASTRRIFNENASRDTKKLGTHIDVIVSNLMNRLIGKLFPTSSTPFAQIGTFSLGYVQPQSFSLEDGCFHTKAELRSNLPSVEHINKKIQKDVGNICEDAIYRNHISPAVGDYSFVSYVKGLTPAEQDWHPANVYRHIIKPRVVLSVGGTDSAANNFGEIIDDTNFIRSICLVKFQYRWDWYRMLLSISEEIEQSADEAFQISLSSAWEDAVIAIKARSVERIIEIHRSSGLSANRAVSSRHDTQSLMLPSETKGDNTSFPSNFSFAEYPSNSNCDHMVVYSAFGRHDYVIAPMDNSGKIISDLNAYYRWLKTIPSGFWSELSNYSSIVEWKYKSRDNTDGSGQDSFPVFKYMLRVNLKNGVQKLH